MTAKELAEKIAGIIDALPMDWITWGPEIESLLSAALEEARLCANEETMLNYGRQHEQQKLAMRQIVGLEYELKLKEAKASAYEQAAQVAEGEKVESGKDRVWFDPVCIQEVLDQPQVALRNMHNSAIDAVGEAIRALRDGMAK